MKVQVGDVVHLKGSKVEMAVKEVGDGTVVCEWHDVDGHPVQHEYKHVMLAEHAVAQAVAKPPAEQQAQQQHPNVLAKHK